MWVVLNSKSQSWNLVERLIFPAPTPSYTLESFPGEIIIISREDGAKVPCLFLPFRHARFIFIYFHANAEDLGLSYGFCKILRDLFQVHILAVEYPGYGICPGTADEAGIMANAKAAIEFVTKSLCWPADGIKLFGRSLGTGPTVALAAEYNVAGVILISPFTGIKDLFTGQVGRLADMIEDRFSNIALAPRIKSPTLIIHGMKDGLVPMEHGRKLYSVITSRRMLVTPTTMSHNTSLLKDVPDWAFPTTSALEASTAPRPAEEETPEAARKLPVIEPGWLAPPTWLCGRAASSSGTTLTGDDGTVEPITRLNDASDAKCRSPTSGSAVAVSPAPPRTPEAASVPGDIRGEAAPVEGMEGDQEVGIVASELTSDLQDLCSRTGYTPVKSASAGTPGRSGDSVDLEVSREYNFKQTGIAARTRCGL